MRKLLLLVAVALVPGLLSLSLSFDAGAGQKPKRKAFGIDKRVPWTTSHVKGSPEPPPPYRTEPAFPKLKFDEPLDLTYAPGTNRLFVAERYGKIWSFVNKRDVVKADLALHLEGKGDDGKPCKQVIYAFTIHPKFKENGYIFVTSIPNHDREGIPNGSPVSRFIAQ